jgi:hypothetical protein
MTRRRAIDATFLFVATAGLIVSTVMLVNDYRTSEPDGPAFTLSQEGEFDIGPTPVGERTITVNITNRSRTDRRILGINRQCTRNCCFGPKQGDGLVTIKAGETYPLELLVEVKGSGRFCAPVYFYLEDRSIRYVELTVVGDGIE